MTGFILFAFTITGMTTIYLGYCKIRDHCNQWPRPPLTRATGFAMLLVGAFQICFVLWSLF